MQDYCYWVFSFLHPYLSKDCYDDLRFSKTLIKAYAPLYDYFGHQLRLDINDALVSATNRENYANRTDQGQNPVYQKGEPEPEEEHERKPKPNFQCKPKDESELKPEHATSSKGGGAARIGAARTGT